MPVTDSIGYLIFWKRMIIILFSETLASDRENERSRNKFISWGVSVFVLVTGTTILAGSRIMKCEVHVVSIRHMRITQVQSLSPEI
jgi:hypothetical protein